MIRTGADFFFGPVRGPERKFEKRFFFKNFSFGFKNENKKILSQGKFGPDQ